MKNQNQLSHVSTLIQFHYRITSVTEGICLVFPVPQKIKKLFEVLNKLTLHEQPLKNYPKMFNRLGKKRIA